MNPNRSLPGFRVAFLMTLAAVGLQILLAIPFEVAAEVYALVTHQAPLHPTHHPLVMGFINLVALGAVIAWGVYRVHAPARQIFHFNWPGGWLLGGIVCAMLGAAIVLSEADNLFRFIFPVPEVLVDLFRDLTGRRGGIWSSAVTIVIIAPVTEELLFRGLILRGLLQRYRPGKAIVLSAVLFALAHANPWQFVSAASVGLMFGWWYWRSGSLVPGLIGHALLNAQALGYQYLPIEIQGANQGDPLEFGGFQPLWFDACGLVLLGLGGWLARRHLPWPAEAPPVYAGPPPPVIPPALTAQL
jgi:membrane protease YdiL (CAAX protease family)